MNFKKQCNYVTKLDKTAKVEYFNNLQLGNDNKPFWEKCKPYFTNKHSKVDTDIMLNENGELLLKDKDIADTFNPILFGGGGGWGGGSKYALPFGFF